MVAQIIAILGDETLLSCGHTVVGCRLKIGEEMSCAVCDIEMEVLYDDLPEGIW